MIEIIHLTSFILVKSWQDYEDGTSIKISKQIQNYSKWGMKFGAKLGDIKNEM